jgi:hypothetical protein
MVKHATRWALGLLAVAAALPLLAAGSATPQRPGIQGTWKLNEDMTARMRENDRQQGGFRGGLGGGMGRPGGFPSGGFPRGGGREGGSPGGPPGGGERGEGGDRRASGPRAAMAALAELTIAQKDGEVTITDKDGHARVLKTDRSKIRDEKAPGGPVELRANWEKDGSLTVQVTPDEGPQRTESYVVSDDGKHLYLTVTMEGFDGRPAFKIRRAYDPATAG